VQGAAEIVRQFHKDLMKTPIGRRLYHLFSRLELSFNRTQIMERPFNSVSESAYEESLQLENIDSYNGATEFEIVWMELLKITAQLNIIRDKTHEGEIHDIGDQMWHEEGERLLDLLRNWEASLPQSFLPVPPPRPFELLDIPLLQHLEPLFYSSVNVAIAMGIFYYSSTLID